MSCRFSREALALHVEGDLLGEAGAVAVRHLAACEECRRFLEELRASQTLLKSAGLETVSRSDCSAMRRDVMAAINERLGPLGWSLRIERALALGLRPSFGIAAFLLLGVVTASVLAQIRPAAGRISSPALFDGADTLRRPTGYREWVRLDRVYVNPSSYREYSKTGMFPEGTVFVWEAAAAETGAEGFHATTSSTLLVSVKDSSKFAGGWGFFDFSGNGGTAPMKARALPESTGCRTCHRTPPLIDGMARPAVKPA